MKKIKWLTMLIVVVLASNAQAYSCSDAIMRIDGMDNVLRQEMVSKCESAKLSAIQHTERLNAPKLESFTSTDAADLASKWANVAGQFVTALSLVAKEMGATVNEFLPTPAGILTAALITWQVMGDDIMEVFKCFCFIILGVSVILCSRGYSRHLLETGVETLVVKGWFGIEKTKTVITRCTFGDLSANKTGSQEMSPQFWYIISKIVLNVFGLVFIVAGLSVL